MQNVPVGWGDAVDAVMLPMGAGLEPSNQTRTVQWCTRRCSPTRVNYRDVSERRDEYFERAWMDVF